MPSGSLGRVSRPRLDVFIATEGLRRLGLQMAEVSYDSATARATEVLAKDSTNQHGPNMTDCYAYWKYTHLAYVNYYHPCLEYVPSRAIMDASKSDDVVYLDRRRFKRAMRRLGVRI